MVSSNKSNSSRLLDPKNKIFKGQERVNAEIFTAMEILGRKLERTEAEKNILEKRLALIESATTIDEETGQLYLPAPTQPLLPKPRANNNSKMMIMTSFISVSIAALSLFLVLFKQPVVTSPIVRKEITFNKTNGWKNLSQLAHEKSYLNNGKYKETSYKEDSYKVKTNISDLFRNRPSIINKKTVAQYKALKPRISAVINIPEIKIEEEPQKIIKEKVSPIKQARLEKKQSKPIIIKKIKAVKIVRVDKAKVKPLIKKVTKKTIKIASTKKSQSIVNNALYIPKELTPDVSLNGKLKELETRAYNGIAEAQHDIGIAYAAGKEIPKNYKRSIYWLEKAANNGIANANYNLAVMYQQGLGVKKDLTKALFWYKNAAELGHPEAMYNLGISYIEGMGVKPQISRSISYFKRAAKAGITQAAYNLGVIFESNMSGEINIGKAMKWYQMAADKGNVKAAEAIAKIKDTANESLTMAERIEPAAGK